MEKLISFVLIDGHGHVKDFTKCASDEKAQEVFLRHRKQKPIPADWAVVEREFHRRAKRRPDAEDPSNGKTRELQDKIKMAREHLLTALQLLGT